MTRTSEEVLLDYGASVTADKQTRRAGSPPIEGEPRGAHGRADGTAHRVDLRTQRVQDLLLRRRRGIVGHGYAGLPLLVRLPEYTRRDPAAEGLRCVGCEQSRERTGGCSYGRCEGFRLLPRGQGRVFRRPWRSHSGLGGRRRKQHAPRRDARRSLAAAQGRARGEVPRSLGAGSRTGSSRGPPKVAVVP